MPKWKDTEKELPERSGNYLVCIVWSRWPRSTYDSIDAPTESSYVYLAYYDDVEKIWVVEHEYYNALVKADSKPNNCTWISHWMELPETPRGI